MALELDDVDVTSFVSMDGTAAVLTMPQPLSYGIHRVRLVEEVDNGRIEERGNWAFEVRQTRAFREASAKANINASGTYRAVEDKTTSEPHRFQGNGGAQLQGALANGGWRTSGTATLIANSQAGVMPGGAGVDVGQFLLTGQAGNFSAQIGDQAIASDNLVTQGLSRRGVSASVATHAKTAGVTAFSMQSVPIAGSSGSAGLSDKTTYLNGATATVTPVSNDARALVLTGNYVTGQNPAASTVGSGSLRYGGDASSIVADGSAFDRRLRLRGELAHSRYSFDGTGEGDVVGHARTGLATLAPLHDFKMLGQAVSWDLGAERKTLSTYFRSPANPSAAADLDSSRVFTGVSWYGLNLQTSVGTASDNVDNIPFLPQTSTRQRTASIGYTPVASPAPSGAQQGAPATPWYGSPNLSASFMNSDRTLMHGAIGAIATASTMLHTTSNSIYGANFSHVTWGWGLTQTYTRDFDVATNLESNSKSTQLNAHFRPGQMTTLGLFVQNDQLPAQVPGDVYGRAVSSGVSATYMFSDTASGNLNYTVRHTWRPNGSDDTISKYLAASLNWIARAPSGSNPGLNLGLDASYNNAHGLATAYTDGILVRYQIFLRATIEWAPAY